MSLMNKPFSQTLSSFGLVIFLSFSLLLQSAQAEVKERYLTISTKQVNFAGQVVQALAVNDSIPAPTLRFMEGDTVIIHVTNRLQANSSIHWHGILLPNRMDGVPNMTYPPIKPGETFTYQFTLRQSGTYWYHSHSGLQEQRGLYGAFVVEPKTRTAIDDIPDKVVVLSDWTNESPHEVLHTLKRGSEWYSLKKGSAQSILGAAQMGMLKDYYVRELSRMPPMDISDIYYDAFLINGSSSSSSKAPTSGKVRLRIINGSASTFFYTQFAGGKMEVVSADGQPVKPFQIERLLLGVAETYDVIVDVSDKRAEEFRATSHDNSGFASLWLGVGEKHSAPTIPWPNAYTAMHGVNLSSLLAVTPWGAMGMSEDMGSEGMQSMGGHMGHRMHHHGGMMKMEEKAAPSGSTLLGFLSEDLSSHPNISSGSSTERPEAPYSKLRSPSKTNFDSEKEVREVRLTLDGDMERYVWMLNNKVMSEDSTIEIKRGEVVRFVMVNRTMMYHPMHLHGHFFRVLNKHGEYSPLKHTVIVSPMDTTVIEFAADEFGDWFFHCHLLYHMMSGMARMVHYDGFEPPSDVDQGRLLHDDLYYMGQISGLSNMAQGTFSLSNSKNIFSTEWQVGWAHVDETEWEAIPLYEYYVNRFWNIFMGGDLEGTTEEFEREHGVAGFRYLLPLNIESRHWVDTDLGYQLALEKTFELTPRFHLYYEAEFDTEEKWELRWGGHYQLSRDLALQAQWHSTYEWGGGIELSF